MAEGDPAAAFDEQFKIVLVGDPGVGKTNLLAYYTSYRKGDPSATYNEARKPTVGVEFATWIVRHPSGARIKAQIWDTAGQERYNSIVKSHYRRAAGAIVVYDVTSKKTFENAQRFWLQQIQDSASPDSNIMECITLVGNKTDLQAEVTEAEHQTAMNSLGLPLEGRTSAKTGDNVDEAFEKLICLVYDKCKMREKETGINLESAGTPQDQGCC
uniref:Ras-related protein Rab-24 n=1 Tax=Fibrocapsa japonica TaxID=94617 RepID=A0A7S2XV75_9STRA|mmetsp:Transcript_12773/g.18849  ORF Transcript_12773/g.18849 Transcript_12773/m.18849 type:complete len:214 (+) Transcript_12773:74-715(+)|eukprot:CAMPEP_0113944646 /NCGR_PEP_ID=MMETSP1339-20121228/35113_1 /TAXON_ID=94617 /ORGANISM="Fibrocapsa japonica" /LENGTH=213 /DNA_ID=CAMNT_0000949921 /DNA_START=74 /DNA_END=715 /DNA_ORIENTATION=- /assembly_acc=CAM_ASM_000762